MSEVETELDRQMSEVDMEVPELNPDANIIDLIHAINKKDYNTAEDMFKNALDDKIGDQLDQARARIAGQMYNGDEKEAEEIAAVDTDDQV
tara:strand:+ start:208 stop:480 length:273 start_codon:yes stop_codon:yes gene_type:complete